MDLKGIVLSKISQRKTNTVCSLLYVESKKDKLVKNGVEWCLPEVGGWRSGDMLFKGINWELVDK